MSFQVSKIVLRELRLPLKEPFRISSGVIEERRIFLLELHHPDGVVGWSECVARDEPNYSPETVDTAWYARREWIAPRLLRRELEGPEVVYPILEGAVRGHEMAKGAVEMGCWELAARLQDKPLARLLGGVQKEIPVGISIGIQVDPDALVERAVAATDKGYQKIKVKIEPGKDIEYIRAVREALGPEVGVMADANSAYTLADTEHLAQLDEFDLMMIEQPLDRDDLVRHAELQKRIRTPVCIDEPVGSVARAEDMITLGSGKILNIKPGRVGGFGPAIAIHDLCEQNGIPVWCGGMLESGVGDRKSVALASLPNFTLPGDLSPSSRYWERDIVVPEWTMNTAGMVEVPLEAPGIGIEVDQDRVEDLTVKVEELR